MSGEHEQTLFESSMPLVTIYSDGSSKPLLGTGGYGVIMTCGEFSQFIYGGQSGVSNNAMELYAVITALRKLTVPCRVHIVSDSQYVVKAVNGWVMSWYQNGWRKSDGGPVSNAALWQEFFQYSQYHIITATWVKGHSTVLSNTICDQFACIGAYTEANKPIPSHLLDIRRA